MGRDFFALARLGGVVVPVNYLLKPAELADCLIGSQAQWAFVEADLSGNFLEAGEAASAVEGESIDLDSLHQVVKSLLATYKVPREWTLREDPLPRTASGKVRKFLLKDS